MNKKKFEIIRVTGVATGVGFIERLNGGEYSESVCSTLFDTGNDERDAEQSEKWTKQICDALNKQLNP